MATAYRQNAAQEDLIEHAVHLAIEAGQIVADRFIDSAEKTFAPLATQPLIGAPLSLRDARLTGLRKWSISEFANHLVF